MSRRAIGSLAFLVALVAAGCGGSTQPGTPAPGASTSGTPGASTSAAPGGASEQPSGSGDVTLNVGWLNKPDTLNPAYAFQSESYSIFHLVYSTLTTQVADGSYVGSLAKDWSVGADNLTWTYHLKDGIKWHNGQPFTADQMVWAINTIMANPEAWATLSNYTAGFAEVTAPDPGTVVIKTTYPIANMDYRTSFLYAIYPPDFEPLKTAEEIQNYRNPDVIGTGPFKMRSYDLDSGVVQLDANADYVGGAPKFKDVIFQTFDNADAMVQALKTGDLDMLTSVPASAYDSVKGFENVNAIASHDTYFYELIINSVDPANKPTPKTNPALADPAVRLAIAQSINRDDIAQVVFAGLAEPGTTIIGPAMGGGLWHSPNSPGVPFDTAAAGKTLEAAGYLPGSDGVRVKGDKRLEFRLQFPSSLPVYARMADMMAGWFAEAGMKAVPEAMAEDAVVAATTPAGDYDLVIWSWDPDPDPDFILSVLTTDQFVEGGWSDSGYHNPEYDQLYLDQQKLVGRNARQQVVWQMQDMVYNDRPYIVLNYQDMLQAYRADRFQGFIESPLGIESAQSLLSAKPVK